MSEHEIRHPASQRPRSKEAGHQEDAHEIVLPSDYGFHFKEIYNNQSH